MLRKLVLALLLIAQLILSKDLTICAVIAMVTVM
jgi:hypothetical protein